MKALPHKLKKNQTAESLNFHDIYQTYYKVVFKHTAYITGNLQAAEDLTQEAFIKLYGNPPAHDNVGAWLCRVASNLAYNYLRDEKVKKKKEPAVSEMDVDKVISIEDIAIRNQEVRLTRRILNTLAERDRMCLLLKFSGYKYHEIAEIIGVDKASIGTILARSQAKFMERYLKEV